MSLALIAAIALVLVALNGPALFGQIGAVVTPSCAVGLTGAAVSVTVQGLNAQSECGSFLTTTTDGGTWYLYTGGQAPLGASICQETYRGDLFTVRDQGSNIYGSGVCNNLIKLINADLATPLAVAPPTTVPTETAATAAASTSTAPAIPPIIGYVSICPTEYGNGSSPGAPAVPAGASPPPGSGLIFFANNYDHILGPLGWVCVGGEGMDGSADMTVSDPADPSAVIHLETAPSCLGCMLDLVCGLFPAAAAADQQQYGTACGPPAGEAQHRVSSKVVEFSDPPGTAGSGSPSGGPYEAVGAAIYLGQANGGADLLTCTLPPGSSVCDSIVTEFIATYGR